MNDRFSHASPFGNLCSRRPLTAYFVLAYVSFWLFLILALAASMMMGFSPDSMPAWAMVLFPIIGSWMPNLAAVVVTRAIEGREGVKCLLKKFFQFRIGAAWYLAALLPIPLALIAGGLCRLTGGPAPSAAGLTSAGFWLSLIGVNLLQGATGEEAGWRGFALPRLRERYGPVKASLLLGIVWNFWHLPLWLMSGLSGIDLLFYIVTFSIGIISLTFLMTWISHRTQGSLVPMVLIHFCFNAGLNLVDARGLGFGPDLPLLVFLTGLHLVAAVIIFGLGGLKAVSKGSLGYGREQAGQGG